MPGVHGGLLLNPNGNNEWKKHVRLYDMFVNVIRSDCLFDFQMARYSGILIRPRITCNLFYFFLKAKAQDVCVKLTEDYESRLATVCFKISFFFFLVI